MRIGYGSLSGLSGSLIAGAVYTPRGERPVVPHVGTSLDWRYLSLGLTTGAISAGVNIVR